MDFFQEEEDHPEQKGCCAFLTITCYQPYFNVSEDDVIDRVKASFLLFRKDFHERVAGNPDLKCKYYISRGSIMDQCNNYYQSNINIQKSIQQYLTLYSCHNQMNLEGQTTYSVAYIPQSAALLQNGSSSSYLIMGMRKILGDLCYYWNCIC